MERCSNCPQRYDPTPHTYRGSQDILVVGEAPGHQEYLRGEPFIGRSGSMLRRALAHYGIDLERVAFTNVVSCWPGDGNPDPSARLVWSCGECNLEPLILDMMPRIIVAAGRISIKYLKGGGLRDMAYGSVEVERNHELIPVYSLVHPAAVQRFPSKYGQMFNYQLDSIANYIRRYDNAEN